ASIWIDQQLGDIYFFSSEEVKNLLHCRKVDADTTLHKLLDWVRSGRILFDPEGCLAQLRDMPREELVVNHSGSPAHQAWFGINFNFAHNRRYFNSGDERYRQALEIRLLYCLMDLLTGYFVLRELPWRGEKAAIVYLQDNDPDYLTLFLQAIRQSDLAQKFHDYAALVAQTMEGFGGVWARDEGSVLMKANAAVEEGITWLQAALAAQYS
ncbi:MAG: hypothetical protein V2J07_08235, partial [Anaerolineae bacterium]|nr:hypothetical protein [Anaerolineae bacterium]